MMKQLRQIAHVVGAASMCLAFLLHADAAFGTTLRKTQVLDAGKSPGGAAISPDGAHALTWSQSAVRFWNLGSGQEIAEDESEEISDCRSDRGGWASRDGAFVALACQGVVLIDMRIPKVVARLGEGGNTRMVSFSANSGRLVRLTETRRTHSSGGIRVIQRLETYELEEYLEPSWFGDMLRGLFGYDENDPDSEISLDRTPSEAVSAVLFSAQPDQLLLATPTTMETHSIEGKLISSASPSSADVKIWACPGGGLSAVTRDQHDSLGSLVDDARDEVTGCVLGEDHSEVWLALGVEMSRWDVDTGKQLWFFMTQNRIAHIEATPDQRFVASAATNGDVSISDWKGRTIAHAGVKKDAAVEECAPPDPLVLSTDGQTVLFLGCKVSVWKVE